MKCLVSLDYRYIIVTLSDCLGRKYSQRIPPSSSCSLLSLAPTHIHIMSESEADKVSDTHRRHIKHDTNMTRSAISALRNLVAAQLHRLQRLRRRAATHRRPRPLPPLKTKHQTKHLIPSHSLASRQRTSLPQRSTSLQLPLRSVQTKSHLVRNLVRMRLNRWTYGKIVKSVISSAFH